MEKFIIVAGSPNSGKTISTNKVIELLIGKGAKVDTYPNGCMREFWKYDDGKNGGVVILEFEGKLIVVITYGDKVADVEVLLEDDTIKSADAIVCCSHATRGRQVFSYFHNYIETQIDLSMTRVIPIHKNLLSRHSNEDMENEHTAKLIVDLLCNL